MSELHIIGEHAERTARWTARSAKLPSPPGVVLRVLRLLEDERTPLAEIKALIAADPALSARLLAYANSAPIRRAGPYVSTIDRAVRALGTRNLYRMLTTLSAQALRIESVPGYGMDEHALWRQSLRAAVAAEDLARYVPEVDWSEAYMAGLLLDVGKLIVGPELRDRGDEIKAIMEASPDTPFDAIERRLFGADHARVGADLARTWRLAAPLQEAIRFHHMPARARAHRELVYVCHLADFVAMAASTHRSIDEMAYVVDEGWRDVVPLRDAQLHALLIDVEERVESIVSLLDG